MAASVLPDSTLCFFPCPLPFIFSSVPFLLTYLSCSPSQVYIYPIPSVEAIWTQMDSLDEASAAERLVVLSAEAAAQDGKSMDCGRRPLKFMEV